MKWVAGAMQGLFIAIVGAIFLAIFQDPIAQRFRSDRIEAWFEMGPWMAHPNGTAPPPQSAVMASGFHEIWAKSLVEEDEDPTFARVTLLNKTSNVVRNLRMRFHGPVGPDAYYQAADGKWRLQQEVSDLPLPDLAPGERKFIYLWEPNGFSEYTLKDTETYSSAGPFRTRFSRPQSINDPFRETEFDRFMDDWFWWIFIGITALFVFGAWVMSTVWADYAKSLLKSDDLYLAEKVRFEQDPKKFQPDYAAAIKANAADKSVNTSP